MGDVIAGGAGQARRAAALASGGAVRVGDRQVETAHERTPRDSRGVEQIADILAGHLDLVAGGCRANVANRVGVADQRQSAVAVADFEVAARIQVDRNSVGLSGYEIERARRRWPE